MGLRKHVVRGMAWSGVEKAGAFLLRFAVGLILPWFIMPEEYAMIAILVVFTSVCSVFVDSGFSAAIIRKKEVGQDDYSSVFAFNLIVAAVLYVLLVLLTPVIADYYGIHSLSRLGPVLFLLVPVNSISIIQATILTRRLDFKSLTKYTLWADLAACMAAVGAALLGCGVWALVVMRLAAPLIRGVILWLRSDWRLSGRFSFRPLRSMLGYSSRLFLSDLANSVYGNISQLFIGKMYSGDQLGFYDQAKKWKDSPVNALVGTIQGVTFPALSRLQDDHAKMGLAAHQVVAVMNFIIFPVMIGLIAVSPEIFDVFLPAGWSVAMPYFRIFCLSGLFVPLSVVSYNIMKVRSDGRAIFRLEMVKKAVATVVLAVTIPVSVEAIVWGQVAIFFSDAVMNAIGAGRFVPWGLRGRLKESVPYVVMSLVMWAAVYVTGLLIDGSIPALGVMVVKIFTGAAVYFLQAWLFRPEAWRETMQILSEAKRGR